MTEMRRLRCPQCGQSKEKRIEELTESIADWVRDEDLRRLLRCFDVSISAAGTLEEYIEELWEKIQIWDFRKGAERWSIRTDDPRIEENRELIEMVSRKLGLLDITEPIIGEPHYILALGGARMTNYNTPLKARSLIDDHGWQGVNVAGLSTFRPTVERDRPHFEKYAPGAETEFHAMCGGIEEVFGVSEYEAADGQDENIQNEIINENSKSKTRIYSQKYAGGTIAALAAPSSEPEKRRANTLDTFMYFLNQFRTSEGSKIILTTNSIYVPFQLMKLMDIALEKDLLIDCVGVRAKEHVPEGKHSMYLQEIKATVDAIHGLTVPGSQKA
ncbi:MAG: hypothetical protein IJ132_02550 [Firmicutes bacterium]|nr:hypothetical protein [Bacillota bacterium]